MPKRTAGKKTGPENEALIVRLERKRLTRVPGAETSDVPRN